VKQFYPDDSTDGACNTRLYSQISIPLLPKMGVGWLRLQISAPTVDCRKDMWCWLHQHFGDEWEILSFSRSGVESEVSVGRIPGARISAKGEHSYQLELSQSVVELLKPAQLQQLCREARVLFGDRVKCSRVDFYKDTTDFTVQNVIDCVNFGFSVTPSKTYTNVDKWVPPAYFGADSQQSGHTLYVGSRQSSKFGRFYDKGLEQGYPPGLLLRFEAELKKDAALVAFGLICDTSLGGWPDLVKSVLLSVIDFRDIYSADDRRHCDRMARQQWWADFVDNATKIKLWIPVSSKTPLDSYLHLVKQYAPTIVMISEWCDSNKIDWDSMYEGLMQNGKQRLKSRHRVKIAMAA
jgi:hypothetical protein